jgi:hypothetical protein
LGERNAELLEAPVMLAISYFAANWVVRRLPAPPSGRDRLATGMIALALMLVFEFGLVLRLRGLTFADYISSRDPVSGAVYYLSLMLFALFPLIVRRRSQD